MTLPTRATAQMRAGTHLEALEALEAFDGRRAQCRA
jgi:hypothetical protein